MGLFLKNKPPHSGSSDARGSVSVTPSDPFGNLDSDMVATIDAAIAAAPNGDAYSQFKKLVDSIGAHVSDKASLFPAAMSAAEATGQSRDNILRGIGSALTALDTTTTQFAERLSRENDQQVAGKRMQISDIQHTIEAKEAELAELRLRATTLGHEAELAEHQLEVVRDRFRTAVDAARARLNSDHEKIAQLSKIA